MSHLQQSFEFMQADVQDLKTGKIKPNNVEVVSSENATVAHRSKNEIRNDTLARLEDLENDIANLQDKIDDLDDLS